MFRLIPAEYWEYGLGDVFRGIAAVFLRNRGADSLHVPGFGKCIPVRSARAGIIAAIRALDLPRDAHVGVPLYCCPVVFKSIESAGCRVRFIDVEPATFCMSAADLSAKIDQIEAVIAVHMFGNLCDMSSLKEAARDKPIIEDCAQSLGSELDGCQSGSFGSIAVFSFRSGKYLSVGEGGALYSNSSDLCSKMRRITDDMAVPRISDECKHVAKTFLRTTLRRRPFFGLIGYPLWQAYNNRVDFTEKTPIVLSRMFKADIATLMKRFSGLDTSIAKHRANAEFYFKALKLDAGMLCGERSGTNYNRYLYPIMFPSQEYRDRMAEYLHHRKIGSMRPYRDIAEIAAVHYGYKGDCPAAEEIARCVLVIPSYHTLKKKEIERIATCVNEGWTEINRKAVHKIPEERKFSSFHL